MDKKKIEQLRPVIAALRLYHRHKAMGLDHFPKTGRVLLVVNHSLATYDIALLFDAIYEETGRITRPLADRWFFKNEWLAEFSKSLGVSEGCPDNAKELLNQEELVAVAPGGMREALRPSSERYQILWDKRMGFARLSYETQTPIILAVCPKADDIYDVYQSPLTSFFYKKFKIPIALVRGLGLSVIPKPVQLTHFLSPLIYPPPLTSQTNVEGELKKYHRQLIKKAQLMISQAIFHRD